MSENINIPSFLEEPSSSVFANQAQGIEPACTGQTGEPCSGQGGSCGSTCQAVCVISCQSCQTACEIQGQSCIGCFGPGCLTGCEVSCQTTIEVCGWCMAYCQGCQVVCEWSSQRPSDWNWSSNIVSGAMVNGYAYLTAAEWNSFISQINLFRAYKNLSAYTFAPAVAGGAMLASMANEAVVAILNMSPPVPPPTVVSPGERITAAFINGLRDSLNSIT